MAKELRALIEQQVETWSGVKPPNATAYAMADGLEGVLKGFEALRGTVEFEDEPSSFEAALQATKDRE